jgi:multidrug efflux pump subunit AcrB
MNITSRNIASGIRIKNLPINSLVHIDYTNTLGSVKRKNQKSVIILKSNVLNGYKVPAVNVQPAREIGDFKKKPDGVTITQTRDGAQQAKTTASLGNALLIALFFIRKQ